MDFNWHTEEDADAWEKEPSPQRSGRKGRAQTLLPIAIVVGILAFGIRVIYQEVNSRIERQTEQVEADVYASANLLHEAARQRDAELFTTVLSGRNDNWTETQQALVAAGAFHSREAWDLSVAEELGLILEAVELTPDLQGAVVTMTLPMLMTTPTGLTTSVTMQRTEVYRLGEQRWLYAPPEPDFWGGTQETVGRWVTVSFPSRDAELGERLAADLDDLAGRFCREVARGNTSVDCEDDLRLRVKFDSDPASLLELLEPEARLRTGASLILPTPTLIGVPAPGAEAEAAYQALLRGYGRATLAGAINELTGYDCCEAGVYYELLQRRLLADLGVSSWPIDAAHYRALFEEEVTLPQITGRQLSTWAISGAEPPNPEAMVDAAALVSFVVDDQSRLGPLDLATLLERSRRLSLWLNVIFPDYSTRAESLIAGQWRRHLFARAEFDQMEPAVKLPDAGMELLCRAGGEQQLYGLNIRSGESRLLLPDIEVLQAVSPAGRRALVISGYELTDEGLEARLWSWENGSSRRLFGAMAAQGLYALNLDPQGRYLPFATLFQSDEVEPALHLLELDDCAADGCRAEEIRGIPFWSPSGERTALISLDGSLFVGDERGQEPRQLDVPRLENFALSWLGDDSIVYPTPSAIGPAAPGDLVRLDVESGAVDVLLSLESYLSLLPDDVSLESGVAFEYVGLSPAAPDNLYLLLLTLSPVGRSGRHLLRLDTVTGELDLVFSSPPGTVGGGDFPPLTYSPDGVWLTIAMNYGIRDPEMHLVNVRSEITLNTAFENLLGYAWSTDSTWLAISETFQLRLVAPDTGAEWLTVHGLPTCTFIRFTD